MCQVISFKVSHTPVLGAAAGDRAAYRFLEFFTAQIRNLHTRRAYVRAVGEFCVWLEAYGVPSIAAVGSIHVAAYVEELGHRHSAPTVKQQLAAIRMMFDWLATGGILPFNPATAVRGPKHVVKRGKTPVLAPEEARQLLDSIDVNTHAGSRDRALIGLMVYQDRRHYIPRQRRTVTNWPGYDASLYQPALRSMHWPNRTCLSLGEVRNGLAFVQVGITSARQPDGVVHRGGGRRVGGRTRHDPGRAARLLAPGDPDGPDRARRVPPGVPAD